MIFLLKIADIELFDGILQFIQWIHINIFIVNNGPLVIRSFTKPQLIRRAPQDFGFCNNQG
jgi:hypothetical protein